MIQIKVFRQRGANPEIHRLTKLPVTIGRGAENSLVLDDLTVSMHHAVIEADPQGVIRLRDVGSTNKLIVDGRTQEVIELATSGAGSGVHAVRVGKFWLEIRIGEGIDEDTVRLGADELKQLEANEALAPWSHKRGLAIVLGLCLGVSSLIALDILAFERKWRWDQFSLRAWREIMAIIVFGLLLSMFSKLHNRQYQAYRLIATLAIASLCIDVSKNVLDFLIFNFAWYDAKSTLMLIMGLGLGLFFGLRLARICFTSAAAWKRALGVGLMAILWVGLPSLFERLGDRPKDQMVEASTHWPMRDFANASAPIDDLMAKMQKADVELLKLQAELIKKEKSLRESGASEPVSASGETNDPGS
ncbi:MAG TPA: FHA domain-containing protein [Pseudobdellovibrionaceae bacterium]|nr:FHA domain-containing protein [Pseudobdellovibrionaceae bacterium]